MPRQHREGGINEVIGTILMVVLIIALAVIIGGIVMGYIVIQPKSAYIPPRIEVVDYAGSRAISLYSRGGDPAALDPAEDNRYVLEIFLDTDRGTFKVVPDGDVKTWNPGETIYIYYNNTAAEYRAGNEVPEYLPDSIPDANILLRVVDKRAQLLVLKEGVAVGGGGTGIPTPTGTTSPTPTGTTSPTMTVTITTTPSPTQTITPSCGTITGRVYDAQNNNGLSGWTVRYRYRKSQGDPWSQYYSTTTGTNGIYSFTNLDYQPAHFYEVSIVITTGWKVIGQTSYEFVLNPGQQCYQTGIDFKVEKL
ncbi:MAG: type IV pilin N-terminal domain-containing protein [Methanolinea tarda]|jgi:hypothetical protein